MKNEYISQAAVDAYNAFQKEYPNNTSQLHGILLMEILLKLQKLTENSNKE